ncbi:hypothetical protein LZ554_006562 [Drepanopeziza brunnea f. sp. 'monogermtubi']|nr:hypothetical protein LZ554_006562 [Drepanopeziza brunnea f. sp. 'monogermtubi']
MSDSTVTMRAEESPDDGSNTITLPYREAPHAAALDPISNTLVATATLGATPPSSRPFRTTAVKTYRTDQLGSRTWECRVCSKPATQVHHAAASILSPQGSKLIDTAVPTCSADRCRTHGFEIAQQFSNTALPESDVTHCGNCGGRSRTALCGGCTFAYNSTRTVQAATSFKRPRNRTAKTQAVSDAEP